MKACLEMQPEFCSREKLLHCLLQRGWFYLLLSLFSGILYGTQLVTMMVTKSENSEEKTPVVTGGLLSILLNIYFI